MNIQISAKNIELTQTNKNFIQEKMDMLEKYLGDLPVINCDFKIEKITNHHQKGELFSASCNLQLTGVVLRVEKTEEDILKAIDKVKSHLMDAIKRHKEKIQ